MRHAPLLMDKTPEGCEILPMTNTVAISDMNMLRALLSNLPGRDDTAAEAAKEREPQLTKPPGSLGRLEEIALWLATWQGRHPPATDKVAVRVFAGNHGVVARGVSAYPAEVTAQMVSNFEAGGAAVNQLCAEAGAELKVIALDLDTPTADFTMQPAMDEAEFLDAFNRGMAAVPQNVHLLCVGEMGIGNTTSAAAICMGLYGGNAKDWTGPGTGVSDHAFETKLKVVGDAVRHHAPHSIDGINYAPFAAFGGWAGAVNKKADQKTKDAAYGFLSYMNQAAQSSVDVTIGATGYNPYRLSQLASPDLFVKAGMPQALAENYIGAINGALNSLNMASDMKIPGANKYTAVVLDTELARYLAGEISVDEALENIEEGWEEVTDDFGRDEQIAAQALALGG